MTRTRRWFLAAAALVLLAALFVYWGTRPQRVAALAMSQLGSALGLDITATGASEYQLRNGVRLVLRDVVAREPGATTPLLRAGRVDVAVPWSTLRSRGKDLAIMRVELDAPVIDARALQHWLAARPASEGGQRTPTLSNGLRVRDGRVVGDGWSVDAIALDVPRVLPDRSVDVRLSGHAVVSTARMPFALTLALDKPANDAMLHGQGTLGFEQGARRLASHLWLSGPLHFDAGDVRIAPLRFSTHARYTEGDTNLPFAFALNGPLRVQGATIALSPAGIALRGSDLVPDFDARAAFAYSKQAALHLDGTLATWPDTWPALPPPIGQSTSPLPFVLDYQGPFDLSDTTHLQVTRDTTRFDGRFRLPEVLAWIDTTPESPLPPLTGTITTPRVDVAGAVLEGVEVRMDDPALGDAAP